MLVSENGRVFPIMGWSSAALRCTGAATDQRFSIGITNFRPVWVGEKPTTFTSFSPDLRPAASTSFSVISFWPFGQTIHNAAAPLRLFANLDICDKSLDESAAKKIHSVSAATFPLVTFLVAECSSAIKSASKLPIKDTAVFGLIPNF